MSKAAVLQTLEPPAVTKKITSILPKVEIIADAKDTGKRVNKAINTWWHQLPNDGVRLAIPIGATLLVGVITGLVVAYARRH